MAPLPATAAGLRPPLRPARAARSLCAGRHLRLLARPAAGRPPRRGHGRPARDHSRSRSTRASWPAAIARSFARHRTITRPRARPHARRPSARTRRGATTRGRGAAAGRLRRPDRMSAADRGARPPVPGAEGAGRGQRRCPSSPTGPGEEWSYERFAEALLATEVDSRDSHGGEPDQGRPASRPARRWRSSTSASSARSRRPPSSTSPSSTSCRPENVVLLGPPGTGKTHLAIALGIRACLAGQRVAFATATEWVARSADAQRHGRLDTELDRLRRDPAAGRRRGRLHPLRPPAANLMFMLVSRRYERASA